MKNTVAIELSKTFDSLLDFMNRNMKLLCKTEVEILSKIMFKIWNIQYYANDSVLPPNFNVDNEEIMNNVKQKIELKNEIDSMRATIDLIEKNKPNNLINNLTNKTKKAQNYSNQLVDFEADIEADENGVIVKNINDLKQQNLRKIIKKFIK
jgi:hypothetical protein